MPRWRTSSRRSRHHAAVGPDLTAQWKSAAGAGSQPLPPKASISRTSPPRAITLRDHVGEQIALGFADPAARLIAAELADGLDEAGYLRADLGEIAERLGAAASDVDAVLGRLPDVRAGRPVCAATSPNAWRCSLRRATASIRRLRRWSAISTCSRAAISRRCSGYAASTRKICSTCWPKSRALDPRPGMAFSGGTSRHDHCRCR